MLSWLKKTKPGGRFSFLVKFVALKKPGEKVKKQIIKKLSDRYRLIIYNDTTFQSVWSMKLSRLKVFTITSLLSSIIVVLVILLIATTALREYIPGYPKAEYRQMLVYTALKMDSLEQEINQRDLFFRSIQAIVSGETPDDYLLADTSSVQDGVTILEYNHDSVFQDKLLAEQTNLSVGSHENRRLNLSQIHFFVPVKGVITEEFNATADHFGVDLVSEPNARISAVMDGTVIFSEWTIQTGYVLFIQHDANLISAYKHNSELLKRKGDRVKAGEAVAIIGSTGELSTGPHLHFELWHNGTPLNPELYIDF